LNCQWIIQWEGNYHSTSVHVANISCDTGGVDNIIKMKNWNQRVNLHQQRKGLTNSPSSPQNRYFESRCPTLCSALSSLENNITPFLSQQIKNLSKKMEAKAYLSCKEHRSRWSELEEETWKFEGLRWAEILAIRWLASIFGYDCYDQRGRRSMCWSWGWKFEKKRGEEKNINLWTENKMIG